MPDLPKITVTSPAYAEGGRIPPQFTCAGADRSPPWSFAGIPAQARFLAAVFDDPDAPRGAGTHWTWWDLTADVGGVPEAADVTALGATEGTTSSKEVGYHGPCPPSGTHRYVLHVYATQEPLGLTRGASVADVHAALRSKAIAQGTLTATFSR